MNAGAQIHALTAGIANRIGRLARGGTLSGFPRVLAFQSAVDATIPAGAVVDGLLARLPPGDHELVLFDVNRNTEAEPLLRADPETLTARLLGNAGNPFTLDLLTNADDASDAVVLRRRPAGPGAITESPLPYVWPTGVFSLSHVALPFPPDDPIYGGPEARAAARLTPGATPSRSGRSRFSASGGCSRCRTASSSGCASTRSSPMWRSERGTFWSAGSRRADSRYSAVAGSRDRKALNDGQMSSRRSIRTDWKFSSSSRAEALEHRALVIVRAHRLDLAIAEQVAGLRTARARP